MMTKYRRITLAVLTLAVPTLFTACPSTQKTYDKYGISFDYPADMALQEEGVIGFSDEATEMAGRLLITKPWSRLDLFWTGPHDDADSSFIDKMLGSFITGRRTNTEFYLGDVVNSERNGHAFLEARFYTEGDEGVMLNMAGAWYCDKSRRVFLICSGAFWDHPAMVTDGISMNPEWPKPKSDASCKMYENIIGSFLCH